MIANLSDPCVHSLPPLHPGPELHVQPFVMCLLPPGTKYERAKIDMRIFLLFFSSFMPVWARSVDCFPSSIPVNGIAFSNLISLAWGRGKANTSEIISFCPYELVLRVIAVFGIEKLLLPLAQNPSLIRDHIFSLTKHTVTGDINWCLGIAIVCLLHLLHEGRDPER